MRETVVDVTSLNLSLQQSLFLLLDYEYFKVQRYTSFLANVLMAALLLVVKNWKSLTPSSLEEWMSNV